MKQHFHSNGKLLITGEYLVLDGAVSLAVPANFGQFMEVEQTTRDFITWIALDHNNKEWFRTCFAYDGNKFNFCEETNVTGKEAPTLLKIFNEAHFINPEAFNAHRGFNITTRLDFPQNWGLGSSSTLINNVASWLKVDPYILLRNTFGGSGYDIAAAQTAQPFTYQLNGESRSILKIDFNPAFKNSLFFVHLNRKQNSRNSIAHYRQQSKEFIEDSIEKISSLTNSLIKCETLEEFNLLMEIHETLISKIIKLPKVKTQLFPDFAGGIKSLGGWGGDFILATGGEKEKEYFKNKGYHTILSYSEMVK